MAYDMYLKNDKTVKEIADALDMSHMGSVASKTQIPKKPKNRQKCA